MKKRKKGGALLLLVLIILVSLGLMIFNMTRETEDEVKVTVSGKVAAAYSLSSDGEYVLNGGSNVLEIKNGRARMTEADCPDAICIKRGWIRRMGESITCLPNRLVVEVVKDNDTVEIVL